MMTMADDFKAHLTMNDPTHGTYSKSDVVKLANEWKESKKLVYRQDPCVDLHFTLRGVGALTVEGHSSETHIPCDLITEIKVRIGYIPWIAERLFEVYKVKSRGITVKNDDEVLVRDVISWAPVPHRYLDLDATPLDAIPLSPEQYASLAKLADRDDLIQRWNGRRTFMLIYPCMRNNNNLFYQFEDGSELLSSTNGVEDISLFVKEQILPA
ncbi:MAG: hypothetical protein J6S17_02740 [Aeriscardovia sp.]|nr:hypothetical protein [Aeriscardovia sp.]